MFLVETRPPSTSNLSVLISALTNVLKKENKKTVAREQNLFKKLPNMLASV
jgi:hypothetical protein